MKRHYFFSIVTIFCFIFFLGCSKEDGRTLETGKVTDIDGNIYNTVRIGDQWWMAQNLRTSKLDNGKDIILANDGNGWYGLSLDSISGYCYYNEDRTMTFYNWYAVKTGLLCPTGWGVPTNKDWFELLNFLGGESSAASKMAVGGSSGFSATLDGLRASWDDMINGPWYIRNEGSLMWSATESTSYPESAIAYWIVKDYLRQNEYQKGYGARVRCINYESKTRTKPVLTTSLATNIKVNSAISGGTITNSGYADITARGVCWSSLNSPTIADNITNDSIGTGAFTSKITGLNPGTTYKLKAYATNIAGTSYGNEYLFTTLKNAEVPTIKTTEITSIRMTTAVSGGNVISDGGGQITTRGVCWSINAGPTIGDNKTQDGSGNGNFTSKIAALDSDTIYYIRAYGTNEAGTSYGNELTFKTLKINPLVTDIDGNDYDTVIIGTQTWLKQNLKVTHYKNGDLIPNIKGGGYGFGLWGYSNSGAYCDYEDNSNYSVTYGRLYNGFAVVDPRNLCPDGWHVPTDNEWTTLTDFLGGASVAGGKMKETGTDHWNTPNTGATNESLFAALPGGQRMPGYSGGGLFTFDFLGMWGFWWSSTEYSSGEMYCRQLSNNKIIVDRLSNYPKTYGISVRCIKN